MLLISFSFWRSSDILSIKFLSLKCKPVSQPWTHIRLFWGPFLKNQKYLLMGPVRHPRSWDCFSLRSPRVYFSNSSHSDLSKGYFLVCINPPMAFYHTQNKIQRTYHGVKDLRVLPWLLLRYYAPRLFLWLNLLQTDQCLHYPLKATSSPPLATSVLVAFSV